MEGIFGIFSFSGRINQQQLQNMASTLGLQTEANFMLDEQVGFGVQRLPLVTEVQTSNPTWNKDGSICVILNGDVYNYLELRNDLEHHGYQFQSNSDAELVANLYLDRGEVFFKELNGLFVVAIWDRRKKEVILAQSRFGGIRQLYYAQLPDALVFASGIRPILASGRVVPEVDEDSITEFFSLGRILPPHTLFQNIRKLTPGYILKCRQGSVSTKLIHSFTFTPEIMADAVHLLEKYYTEAVRKSLAADGSVGLLLSGGFDSSLNVAMASKLANRPLDTFSIRFTDSALDESYYARLMADHFKTHHHEYTLDSSDALEILPQLVWCQEEPLFDFSVVPSYHVARFAKSYVDAVIAGDGPDHLWGRGYRWIAGRRFFNALPGNRLLKKLVTKDVDGRLLKGYPVRYAKRLAYLANEPVDKSYLDSTAWWLGNTSSIKQAPKLLSEKLQARWCDRIDLAQLFPCDALSDFNCQVICDLVVHLSFAVLAKFGKVAAGQSLLVREPYLDNFLVDHVNHLPETLKVRGHIWQRLRGTAQQKYLLHQTLGRKLLPQEILSKPKGGFTPPMHRWLREYLEGISVDSILSSSIKQAGFFNTAAVKNIFEGYLKNLERSTHGPYMLLSFAVWHRLYIDKFTTEYPTMSLTELLHE